jgi:hypothetical protein
MVKKPHSEERWKTGRISIRIHEDLRSALDFLAARDRRPLSNYVEMILLDAARERLANQIDDYGEREDDRPWVRRIDLEPQKIVLPRTVGFNPPRPKKR